MSSGAALLYFYNYMLCLLFCAIKIKLSLTLRYQLTKVKLKISHDVHFITYPVFPLTVPSHGASRLRWQTCICFCQTRLGMAVALPRCQLRIFRWWKWRLMVVRAWRWRSATHQRRTSDATPGKQCVRTFAQMYPSSAPLAVPGFKPTTFRLLGKLPNP